MDIASLVPVLKVTEPVVVEKAHEFERQSRIRIRRLGEAEICRSVVCLHLASLACNKDEIPEALAVRYSGTSEKVYRKTFQLLRNALGVRSVRLEQLVIQFGCMSLLSYANDILTAYQSRVHEANDKQSRENPTAAVVAAILLLCAKKRKVPLDVKDLMRICQITGRDLKQASCLVEDYCEEALQAIPAPTKTQPPGKKRRSKRSRAEMELTPNDCGSDNVGKAPEDVVDPSISYLFSGNLV